MASRQQAATWIAKEANPSESMACDRAMCAAISDAGFPRSDLTVLGSHSRAPLTSALVIDTPYVTTLLGTSFFTNSAPMIIASFGSRVSLIEIRVIAPDGAFAYQRELASDLAYRKFLGAQLLSLTGNYPITVSPTARAQMQAGDVDVRALLAIVVLAGNKPIDVIGFGSVGVGADSALPLRYVDLAENGKIAHISTQAYVASMLEALKGLQYPVLWAKSTRLPDGTTVLRIDFSAPTPLGIKQ